MQCILEHMGAHILYNATLNSTEERCGLCLRPAPMCHMYLKKGRGVRGKSSVNQSQSKCSNLVRFNYKNAAQSSKRSPCSNVPIICSLCPTGSPTVWTYSLHPHYQECHCIKSALDFPTHEELSQLEKDGMKRMWSTCFNQQGSYRKKWCTDGHKLPLSISEAHRSRLLVA